MSSSHPSIPPLTSNSVPLTQRGNQPATKPALPSTLEARPGDGLPQLQQRSSSAGSAGGLEVGQAQSPLRDHLLALYKELDTKPLKVVLFGHDEVGREIALQWLGGESLRSLASIPAGTGTVELELVAGAMR